MTKAVDERAPCAAAAWFDPRQGTPRLSLLGEGHINDTWLVELSAGRFVLQRINERVFPDPLAIMRKVAGVVAHLERDARLVVPPLVALPGGARWHQDAHGGVWRLWEFIPGTRTLQRLDAPAQAEAAGRAFGELQRRLADLREPVPDPIPGFMQLGHYLEALDAAVASAAMAPEVEEPLAIVQTRRDLAALFNRRNRLVHGDCKVNNVLFQASRDEVACIVDLDTVMVGHWSWDFGDLVRSAAATSQGFSLERYAGVVRGFIGSGAVDRDLTALVLAPRYAALMLGVRFLTDHLRGDRYFKVHRRGENLTRAVQQLQLLRHMERREAEMRGLARRA